MINRVKLIVDFTIDKNFILHNTKDILNFLHDFENADILSEENCFCIFTNNCNKILDYCLISKGNEKSSLLDLKAVFKVALLTNASKIVLVHNHPSGNLQPSKSDLKTTKYLKFACKIMGFDLLDNAIIANGNIHSLLKK